MTGTYSARLPRTLAGVAFAIGRGGRLWQAHLPGGKIGSMAGTATHAAFTMTVRMVEIVAQGLRAAGVEIEPVLARVGLESLDLQDPDARISHDQGLRLMDAAVEATGDEAFGLHAGAHYQPGSHTVEFLACNSSTLGECLQRVCRYYQLGVDAANPSLEVEGKNAVWRFRMRGGLPIPRTLAEMIIGVGMTAIRQWTSVDADRPEYHFTFSRPADIEPYVETLGSRLAFDSDDNAVIFPARALDTPLLTANSDLCRILESHAEQLLADHPAGDGFVAQVRETLASELQGGNPQAGHLARRLGMSPRNLRRQLQQHGTSHHELLEELRRGLAHRYLTERNLAIDEVALMLGYSESSTFHRAFKRWTGLTPVEYKRQKPSEQVKNAI